MVLFLQIFKTFHEFQVDSLIAEIYKLKNSEFQSQTDLYWELHVYEQLEIQIGKNTLF